MEPGRTYILQVEEMESGTRKEKIATLPDAMRDEAFLKDLESVSVDFSAVDFKN